MDKKNSAKSTRADLATQAILSELQISLEAELAETLQQPNSLQRNKKLIDLARDFMALIRIRQGR